MTAITPRQRQVVVLAANGYSNTQIGERLGISRHTVDRHLTNIYLELGVRDRAQAVAILTVTGVLGPDDIRIPYQQQEQAA